MASVSISSIFSTTLPIPPSCIAFVPGLREWCVIGTYFLEKGSVEEERGEGQKRSGSLVLARLGGGEITFTSTSPTPFAIFDLHFSPYSSTASTTPSPSSHLLGLASSTGSIALYTIDPLATAPASQIAHLRTLQLFPQTDLLTYFSWHPTVPLLMGAALADGRIVLCDCSGEEDDDDAEKAPKRVKTLTLHAHSLEAWVTAFAPDGSTLYSGGDDAALKGVGLPLPSTVALDSESAKMSASAYLDALASKPESDTNDQNAAKDEGDDGAGEEEQESSFVPPWKWQDVRTHAAGVTFILPLLLPHPLNSNNSSAAIPLLPSNLLLTGSYDESLRLIAPPPPVGPRRARELAHVSLEGGVWRITIIDGPTIKSRTASSSGGGGEEELVVVEWTLLVSCMHAGTRVVQLTGSALVAVEQGGWEWAFEVLARFEEHQSMNYGSVVQPEADAKGGEKRTVVSTSFYDRLVAVWELP